MRLTLSQWFYLAKNTLTSLMLGVMVPTVNSKMSVLSKENWSIVAIIAAIIPLLSFVLVWVEDEVLLIVTLIVDFTILILMLGLSIAKQMSFILVVFTISVKIFEMLYDLQFVILITQFPELANKRFRGILLSSVTLSGILGGVISYTLTSGAFNTILICSVGLIFPLIFHYLLVQLWLKNSKAA